LRNRVKLFAAICAVVGVLLILDLSLPVWLRAAALMAWLGFSFHELYCYSRLASAIALISLEQSGDVIITDVDGTCAESHLLPGSVVTSSLAWLRLRLPNGRKFGELLCKNEVQPSEWHRLQLLWQQARPFIGSAKGS